MPLLNGEVGYRKEFATNREYSFIYVGIQHLARVNGVIGGSGKKFYYHNDHLGSALAVTDEKGNKVVERDFTPFGERINTDVYDDEPRDLEEDDSGFTGKDWDEDVGLYYYNARWYDPEVGRFISEDSVADDPNLYGYCFNNPINNIDPTGHWNVNVNWNKFLSKAITKTIWNLLPTEVTDAIQFCGFIKGIDNSKWAKFLHRYTSMNENDFKEYLKSEGINYEFNENNTKNYVFNNSEGQTALNRKQFAALKGDEKLAAFEAMKGNIKVFLENNPGLSLEQVRGIFDSAVMSADNSWGFGKNEFRFEGRGSNYNGLYNAEAVVMNEGMVLGVFTRASTLPDDVKKATVNEGIYDYKVGRHHLGRQETDIGQAAPKYIDENGVERYYSYINNKGEEKLIDSWTKGAYKALRLQGTLPATKNGKQGTAQCINSHVGFYWERGSEGCMTMYMDDYLTYMNLFNSNDSGKFIIIR